MERQIHYLEKDNQFWEITCQANKTSIRAGKKGKPGRKFVEKTHESASKARQFSTRQVNGKIIQGFQDPNLVVPQAPMIKLRSKRSSLRLKMSNSANQAAVNRVTKESQLTRANSITGKRLKLERSDTVVLNSNYPTGSANKQWRKPPKKQTTIRRNANKLVSKPTELFTLTKRKQTVTKQQSAASGGSHNNTKRMTVTRDSTRISLLSSESLPHLVRKRTSWDKPKLFGPDISMPKLKKETD